MRSATALIAALCLVVAGAPAVAHAATAKAEWRPGTPPISTPWTNEVGPDNALPEYPRPQLVRNRWKSLNGVWQFAAAGPGQAPPLGRNLPERVLVPYPIESALSGIQRHEDRMWYRRTFNVPAGWRADDQRIRLNFGAVDYDTVVWVNGTQVGTHRGGYDAFSLDITAALRDEGQQEIVIGVTDLTDQTWQPIGKQRNVPDRGIFYTSTSGIWQSVWLEPVAASSIDRLVLTPDVPGASLRLTAKSAASTDGLTVEAVASADNRVIGKVTGAANAELRLPVPSPKLWSPDSPFLYDLKVRLLDHGQPVDVVTSYFGMRSVGIVTGGDGRQHMALNGKVLFNMSTLDQGFWPDGIYTAPTDEALKFDLAQHKRLGFNTIRKHIKVEPDRWYYWADKLGLMIWQDMPAMRNGGAAPDGARQEFERQLHTMVEQHRSWTSVTVWVLFNEGWAEWDRTETGRIADEVGVQDPSRLVNAHSGVNCCDSHGDSGRGNILDYHDYPGPASPMPESRRVAVDGEHGGYGLLVPGHMWFGDGGAYEMEPDSATLTSRYVANQRNLMAVANRCGLSAGVYTQITDVEHEVNGFFTYDRQVKKMDFDQVRAVNDAVVQSVDGSGAGAPPLPPGTPGLTGVGYWPFDEGSGTVTADAAGDHDGTLINGPMWTTGRAGSALQFNGDNQYVDAGAAILDTTGNYTASAWVRLDSLGGFATAVSQDGANRSAFFLQYSGADNRFAFSFAGVRALAQEAPQTGRWYHLVGVRDAAAGKLTLYVDGRPAGTASSCIGEASTGHTVIGRARFNNNPVDYWRGAVDQVHVYDRALSAAEVGQLFAATASTTP